jgi:hypothetical protein
MAVTFELPGDVEQNLRREFSDFDLAAKEATLLEIYRQGRISQSELSRASGCRVWRLRACLRSTT